MIAVIDYGAGNVFNVLKACQYLGQKAELTADPQKISQADVVLFPGVGAFGSAAGLGLIPGQVVRIPDDDGQRIVPQVGWNQNKLQQSENIFKSIDQQYTYFVHSYYAKCADEYIVSTVDYGVAVPAIVQKDNVYGFQFHPEKSGQVGLKLLQTFFEKAVRA